MEQINKRLKTQTTVMSLFLQGFSGILIGTIMVVFGEFFLARGIRILLIYFGIVLGINMIQIAIYFAKDGKRFLQSITKFIATAIIILYIYYNLDNLIQIIPLSMSMWAFLTAFSNLISFIQYRSEKFSVSFRYFLTFLINLICAVLFLTDNYRRLSASINVIGLYLIMLGVSLLLDGLAQKNPHKYKSGARYRNKIPLPTFMTTFIPISLLKSINNFFKDSMNEEVELKIKKEAGDPNVEIFIHISNRPSRMVGHVDLAIGNTVYCYGAYDAESIKLGGVVGTGLLFEVYNKAKYIQFCKEAKDEVLIGFGLVMTEEEIGKMQKKLEDLKSQAYVWQSNAQRAKENGENPLVFEEYCSKLSNTTDVTFYKFVTGSYQYFWILGTNCVKFADGLLRSSGIKTVMAGIITPGTYFTFLNGEFMRENSIVVSREIYLTRGNEKNV